ncbi:putative fungal pheromoneG-protein-coupled receptor [Ganoderma leucocontextum]|nr:putative fungal pheromoneG-protein-coupled receptor [Ganoderma leucocontextum]
MALSWYSQVDIIAAFSFLGFILISIPIYWHCVAWNVGCVLYIFWVGGQCLFHTINVLVWKDNVINSAPMWCDIFIRFYIGASIGVCSASLVINRRLYHITTVSTVSITRADKWRKIIVDLSIGLGIPVLAIVVFWFYQGHRFDLIEGVGCIEAYPNTWLALILYFIWPLAIGLVSAIYCILTLKSFLNRRKSFCELMASNEHLTFNRYFRLMGLAAVEVMFTIPLTIYNIVSNFKQDPYPWRGFADLHSGFGRVDQYPAVVWRADPQVVSIINFRLWAPIACALTFFLFFGLSEEARKHYRMAVSAVAQRMGVRTSERSTDIGSSASKTGSSGRATIPTFVNRAARRTSLDSVYSDDLSTSDSAIGLDNKAPYSLSGRSTGSSTLLEEAQDTIPAPIVPPVPRLPPLPHIALQKPPAAYSPTYSQHVAEARGMLASTTADLSMV